MSKLNGKTALVTGASRGIGRAIAKRLAADGANVIAHYGGSEADARALAAEIGATLVQADLAAPDGAERLAAQIEGPVDILVHNAGIFESAGLGNDTVQSFDRQFAVNVRSPHFLTQALLPRLSDGGRVIFLSSVVARAAFGDGAMTPYAATKGAVNTMVLQWAAALGARGITVNAVAPGMIDTNMADWARNEAGEAVAAIPVQVLKRVGKPEDVADVVAFLAGPDSRWITGEVLETGGGTKL